MPYTSFKQIFTPLILFGIRFYKDEDGGYWMKIGRNKRRRMTKKHHIGIEQE